MIGGKTPYKLESISGGTRVRIGDADAFISHGEHRYTIRYRATREIGFFEDFDELYWNVTGNGWAFAIDKARIAVELPEGASILRHAEYTGFAGEKGSNATGAIVSGNQYFAETTSPLQPSQGLTIAVAWQKGIITPPSESQKTWWMLRDNAWLFAGFATPLLALGYYFYAWRRVGRDPESGTIIPLFRPPSGLGAAEVRYLWKQNFDKKGFAAVLVGLATKGGLRIIDDEEDNRTIERRNDLRDSLSDSEKAAHATLMSAPLLLKQASHKRVQELQSAVEASLKKQFVGSYFNRNFKWLIPGILVSALGLLYAAWTSPQQIGIAVVFVCIWLGIWWSATLAGLVGAVGKMITGRGIADKLGAGATILFLLPFLAIGLAVPAGAMLFGATSPEMVFIGTVAVVLVLVNVLFFRLMPAATPVGQKVLDQIEGFRLYLATAEEDRLNILNPPEKTPALFERYLPYAIALDCENEWGDKFVEVLAAAAAAGAATAPHWYSGNHWSPDSVTSFTKNMGSSMASTLGSASSSPGSSSGSGGGGSSGGGGGGGGGGGW